MDGPRQQAIAGQDRALIALAHEGEMHRFSHRNELSLRSANDGQFRRCRTLQDAAGSEFLMQSFASIGAVFAKAENGIRGTRKRARLGIFKN